MKRSEINAALREMEAMTVKCGFHLPQFCFLTPEQWKNCGHDYDEVRDNMLGWDITDYGLGRFDQVGFSLITLRNRNQKLSYKYVKLYGRTKVTLQIRETLYFLTGTIRVGSPGRRMVCLTTLVSWSG